MVRDAVAIYNALIDSEEEDFLENDVFAVSLMNFVNRTVGSGTMGVGEDIEAHLVHHCVLRFGCPVSDSEDGLCRYHTEGGLPTLLSAD
jgi:hypothetical protein